MVCIYVDPIVTAEITTVNIPIIYQPLTLQCNATIVRGITGTVDIIWTTGDTQVRRINNVTASSIFNFTSLYNDSFTTPSLNISDVRSVYQCEVLINSIVPTAAKRNFFIPIPGTYVAICTYVWIFQYTIWYVQIAHNLNNPHVSHMCCMHVTHTHSKHIKLMWHSSTHVHTCTYHGTHTCSTVK